MAMPNNLLLVRHGESVGNILYSKTATEQEKEKYAEWRLEFYLRERERGRGGPTIYGSALPSSPVVTGGRRFHQKPTRKLLIPAVHG